MPRIHVLPEKATVDGTTGKTLLETLRDANVPIAHACGGLARCSTCRVQVVDGLEHCAERNDAELAIAQKLGLGAQTRLACQTQVSGPVSVRRLVLDDVDRKLATQGVAHGGAVGRDLELAVMFSDVADFTPLTEALPAYDVVHVLDRWFMEAGQVVERHGGRVDNYMGDGFLAVFEDVEAAVDAGLALLAAAERLSRYVEAAYGLAFRSRLGVDYGAVVVGTLGAAHNRRTTVIGDAVNAAARIEGANKELGSVFLVSEQVERRLGARFERGRSASVALKGKAGSHRVVEIVGARNG